MAAGRDAVEWAQRGGGARRWRDSAHVDRPRRHAGRLRLRADGRRLERGLDSRDRVGRRRHVRSFLRRLHRRAERTRRSPHRSSTTPSTPSRPEDSSCRPRRPRAHLLIMLIPSIDLQDGRIVQLVQGEKLAVESRRLRRLDRAVLRLPQSPVDRSRRCEGRRRQRGAHRVDLRRACPAASAAASGRRNAREQCIGAGRHERDSRLVALHGTAASTWSSRGVRRGDRRRNASSPRSTAAAVRSSSTAGARRFR